MELVRPLSRHNRHDVGPEAHRRPAQFITQPSRLPRLPALPPHQIAQQDPDGARTRGTRRRQRFWRVTTRDEHLCDPRGRVLQGHWRQPRGESEHRAPLW